ncbi:MAG: DUF3365 domain-containing protein [Planctomycetaceae bacterium]|nr:DUF3365 domain-containing protein [Planctomycetaceae bacterium]
MRSSLLFLLALFVGAGCTEVSPPAQPAKSETPPTEGVSSWQIVEESNLNEAQAAHRDRALAASSALMEKLKGRLKEVVSKDGLAAAITVCKDDAPRLAKEVSKEHGLSIGRTSHRLRNPANKPPVWAESLVADRVDKPTYLAVENRLAAFLPIPTGPLCLNCHGTKDGIPADVLAALDEKYPDDQATGFEEGDLRGWFWVEADAP